MFSGSKAHLLGRATHEPLFRNPNGFATLSVQLACNRTYKDQAGELKEATSFIFIEFIGKLAESLHGKKTIAKGDQLLCECEIRTHSWTDESGQQRTTMQFVVDSFTLLDDVSRRRTRESSTPVQGQ